MSKTEKAVVRAACSDCGGTGWLHGCQRWTPEQMRKGTPYYSERCSCARHAASKEKRNGKR